MHQECRHTYQVEGSTKVHSDESGPEYIHHPALDASNAFQECSLAVKTPIRAIESAILVCGAWRDIPRG